MCVSLLESDYRYTIGTCIYIVYVGTVDLLHSFCREFFLGSYFLWFSVY